MLKKIRTYTFLSLLVFLASCDRGSLISNTQSVDSANWNIKDLKEFNFEAPDTINGYDFRVLVRNNEDYKYRNLFLFINMEYGNKIVRDTVQCVLANKEGKWLGTGVSSEHNSEILYRRKQRFPMKGEYKITIEQAMRDKNISGIGSVGISISKSK